VALISINTLIFQGHDLPAIMREIAELGVTSVELAFLKAYAPDLTEEFFTEEQGRRLRRLLAEFGLTGPAVSAHMDLGAEDAVEAFRRRMRFAKAIGAGFIISNASCRSRAKTFFANMEQLADLARVLGMVICLENPGDGEEHVIDSARTGAAAIQRIGSEQVRMNYDVGNVFISSRGTLRPEDDLGYAIACSAHYHLKDIRADPAGYFYCDIGGGLIDYRPILKALAAKAPDVPIGIEIPLRLKRGRDWVPFLDRAVPDLSEIRRTLKASLDFVTAQGG